VLNFGRSGNRPTAESLATLAKTFGLPPKKTRFILSEVGAAFDHWAQVFQHYQVDEKDRKRLAADSERRRKLNGYS